ncbi:MAG: ribonuclease D [bacterium]|nr:ribonuclease D [bacterium]
MAESHQPLIVTTDAELDALCNRLAQARRFAFDTEFIMEDAFCSEVCLIQAATDDEVALIDPLAGVETGPFWQIVADPEIETLVHAGQEDLALCWQLIAKPPANVFDVQIAAGLVGRDYPLSLARLVRGLVGVRLHKSQTLTDWRRRPLTDAQRIYAADDVAHIPAAHAVLLKRLEEQGRLDWAREEFARFELPETYDPPKQTRLLRLKGVGSLDGEAMAVASALLDERDLLAQEYNRPARAVLRDHLLVEIARHRWTKSKQIRSLRGLHLRSASIERLTEAVGRGLAISPEERPAPPVSMEYTPEETMLTALLTAVLRDYCHAHQVAFSLTATKQTILQLICMHTREHAPPSPLSAGWRGRLVGPILTDVLAGRTAIRVTGPPNRSRLKLSSPDPDGGHN